MGTIDEANLRRILGQIDADSREALRQLLVADQGRRDAAAGAALRQGTTQGNNVADLIDLLTLDADTRRQLARMLGEMEASDS